MNLSLRLVHLTSQNLIPHSCPLTTTKNDTMPPKAVPLPTYNQVTKHNLAAIQPMIVQLLKHASFIALDAEFTGLGSNLNATRANDMQERYHNLSNLAKSHALVAFGLSIFILDKAQGSDTPNPDQAYKVHNFNFSMLFEVSLGLYTMCSLLEKLWNV